MGIAFLWSSTTIASSIPPYMLLQTNKNILTEHLEETSSLEIQIPMGSEMPEKESIQPQEINTLHTNKTIKNQHTKLFQKGLKRADILEAKNNKLQTPLYIEDTLWCLRNYSFESYTDLGNTPNEAFSIWMNYCSFFDFENQVTDAATREQRNTLTQTFHHYSNVNVPEWLIAQILNTENWDNTTKTILGNQQGFVHTLDHQQTQELRALGIEQLIGVGLSSYSGSTASRKINLRNAASKLNGKIIHPGQSISVANTLAPFTYGNGYTEGIVIKEGENEKEMGGGVCQSVTTIFRAWQNSGLEVTSFKPHSKSIGYYGGIGLDATMYKGPTVWSTTDLLLKNNSENSVLIKVVDADPYQIILLYGTKDRSVSLQRTSFEQYSYSQIATWKRSIEYNNSGEWVDNYFSQNQSR